MMWTCGLCHLLLVFTIAMVSLGPAHTFIRRYSSSRFPQLRLNLKRECNTIDPKSKAVSDWKINSNGMLKAIASFCASFFLTDLHSMCEPRPAHAAIANLADVGVKEFLVKDGKQFLRLTVPLGSSQHFDTSSKDAKLLQEAAENLELVRLRFEQVGYTNPTAWNAALKDANAATTTIKSLRSFLMGVDEKNSEESKSREIIFDEKLIPSLSNLIEALRAKDIENILQYQDVSAELLAQMRILQLPPHALPFSIPTEYQGLPALKGRAKVKFAIHYEGNKGKGFLLQDGKSYNKDIELALVVDGYHAPITAGNFVDLVNKGFYNKMPFQKIEELIIQTGKPAIGEGYYDEKTQSIRKIPLELFYKRDKEPVYDITSDDDMRATETMALPFQAYGALGMARDNDNDSGSSTDSASSEFFFLKWKQALVPPGRNTLDGYYSSFGYVTENGDLLGQVTEPPGATIQSAKVIEGLENLVLP